MRWKEEFMPKRIFIFLALFLLIISGARGGGWNNTLMGWKALGLGGAFVGVADDPSAVFYNPAGLVFQRENINFSIGGFSIWPTHEYVMPNGVRAQSRYNASLPQIFFSYRSSSKLTLGFGFYAPYAGGGVDWKEEELGRPFKSMLGIYTFTPTLSYQISEKLSLGLNLNFYGFSTSAQYTMWSALDKVEKTIKNIPLTGDKKVDEQMNFKDILIWRAGVEGHIFGGVFLRGGLGLDRYATPKEALNINNIDVDKVSLLGGIGCRTGKMQIDFVYAYAAGKEREKEAPAGFPLTERYNLSALIMGLGVTFSF